MSTKKRPVVQLTPLLDLLFIMIFVSLMTPVKPDMASAPINDGQDVAEPQLVESTPEIDMPDVPPPVPRENIEVASLQQQVEELEAELVDMQARLEVAAIGADESEPNSGAFNNLFVANVFYLDKEYTYKETKLFLLNPDTGLHSIRLNITGASVVNGKPEPMDKTQIENYKRCSDSNISRESISETCEYGDKRVREIDCKRTNDTQYMCTQMQRLVQQGSKPTELKWQYRLDLISIYDPNLE